MNEITRIHIAKVPYDVETSAKRAIENYVKTLSAYANDDEILQDIEIRITEILSERGVQANGVISEADVKAIREQLGEPEDFMSEDDKKVAKDAEISGEATRKLFRSADDAILGGVLSGFAKFFNIDPIWFRLIFVVLLLASFGTAFLIYIILWLVIPPARTAAEKLQMSGRPVTLESIKEQSARETRLAPEYDSARTVRRVLRVLAGTAGVIAAVGTLMFTIGSAVYIGNENLMADFAGDQTGYIASYVLAIISGVLLSALFGLVSYAIFTAKLPKRIVLAGVSVIVVGMLTFGTAAGLVMYGENRNDQWLQRNIMERKIATPEGLSNIKNLTVDVETVRVDYVVSNQTKVTYSALRHVKAPEITVNGDSATVTFKDNRDDERDYGWRFGAMTITVYGPTLENLHVKKGDATYENKLSQPKLSVTSDKEGSLSIISGKYDQLIAHGEGGIDATSGRVIEAISIADNGATHNFATVKSLEITVPEACTTSGMASITARGVTSGQTKVNGKAFNGDNFENDCANVQIGDPYAL